MSGLQATLEMYRVAAREAAGSWNRSWIAVFFLMIAAGIRFGVALAVSPLGIAGGFVVGFVDAALVGAYLELVRLAVTGRRRLGFDDARDSLGKLFSETLSVLFLFSIAAWILGMAAPLLLLVLIPVANLAFNPVPELIYLGRETGTELLGRAWRFMQGNWPEWLVPNLVAIGVAAGALAVLGLGAVGPLTLVAAAQLFGPYFGFNAIPSTMLGVVGLRVGVPASLLALAAAHAFMLFRGHLYLALSRGSRRSREWQQRMRG